MKPRRRRADKCWIVRNLDMVEPYGKIVLFIITSIAAIGVWINRVEGFDGRISENKNSIAVLNDNNIRMERKLDYLMYRMGFPYKDEK